jgi:hypothetical protein
VAASPETFQGQQLTLSGQMFTDFQHGAGIAGADCLRSFVRFGRAADPVGGRAFYEAWRVSSSCPRDTLFLTVSGRIERQEISGIQRWVLVPSEYSEIRRVEGSNCPITIREYQQQLERNE